MALTPGARIGPYEIIGSLGAGGMGEVYRARDTRLGRDVAIKVLPRRRSRTTPSGWRASSARRSCSASLNHPNIAAIYGLEEVDGAPCLVLEFVEGETLAERLAARPAAGRPKRSTIAARSPRRSRPRTSAASSIAISSPPTSRSRRTAR